MCWAADDCTVQNLVSIMKGLIPFAVIATIVIAGAANPAEAQLQCEVPGECFGSLMGFVEEDDPVRYRNRTAQHEPRGGCAPSTFLSQLIQLRL